MRTGIVHPIGVRKSLCVSVLGVNSRFTFQELKRYFDFGVFFVKQTINFNGRIRIRCIELYMVTWYKHIFRHLFENFQKCPRSVNNFPKEHVGGYV